MAEKQNVILAHMFGRRKRGEREEVRMLLFNPDGTEFVPGSRGGLPGPEGPEGPAGAPGPPGAPGSGTVQSVWKWQIAPASPPMERGEIGAIDPPPRGATELITSCYDRDENNRLETLQALQPGDHIHLQISVDPESWHVYEVTGPVVDQGEDTYSVPVATDSGSPPYTAPTTPIDVLTAFQFALRPGPPGPKGDPGKDGELGPQGLQGPQGEQGVPGPEGLQGPQGPAGPDGTGVAIAGVQGPQGEPGPEGPQGAQGPQGIQGESGTPGADGAQGPQGEIGPTGSQGPPGEQGIEGPQGIQGLPGLQGPSGTGEPGDQGPPGPQGERGPEGPQGIPGPEGPTGAIGPQGTPGSIGPSGAKGDTGPGVVIGGTPGHILAKKSGADYDTQWVPNTSGWTVVRKAADESFNDNTLQDDNELQFQTVVGIAYEIELLVIYANPAGANPDIKCELSEDATARGATMWVGLGTNDAAQALTTTDIGGVSAAFGTAVAKRVCRGLAHHVGNGGLMKFRWAQNTKTAGSPTFVYTGSVLRYRTIA